MRFKRSVMAVAGAIAFALAPGGAQAAGPPLARPLPLPPPEAVRLINDATLTVRARRQINADAALARLNLGVRVRQGLAEVWGPAGAADLPGRVKARLLEVEGITEVRCRLYAASPRPDVLARQAGPPPLPVVVVHAAKPLGSAVRSPVSPNPEVPTDKSVRPVRRTEGDLVSRPAVPPPPPPEDQSALREAIARLQRSHPSYRDVTVTLRDGKVLVKPAPGEAASATELAEKLRDVPHVGAVVLLSE